MWNLKNKTNEQQQQKKNKIRLIDTEDKLVVAREEGSWVVGKMGEGDQEVQSSSYKIHKSWGSNVQHMRYSQ